MLVDSVEITVQAGKGGDGVVAWRREKYVDKGGPAGGDGGRGGSVFLLGDNNVDTLSSFRFRKVFQAEDGQNGMAKKMYGHAGEDLILPVPVGTVVTDSKSNAKLADITEIGQKIRIAKGGDGGLGNPHFASATHQRPDQSTPGKPGEKQEIKLELRLIADVALIGQPNAGKSSIINSLTDAHSRIGEFAFSTREPVLGVMEDGQRRMTIVDLPGLLEGAHRGKGLGDEFLKHAQRVKSLVHVVDSTQPDIEKSVETITNEISQFDPQLAALPSQLVLNKIDLLSSDEIKILKDKFPSAILLSAQTKEGIEQLRQTISGLGA
jgi:GTP-binding protein